MATQGISFKQFSRLAPHVLRTRKPLMGHGRHGIGKSELVYQLGPVLQCILGLDKDKSFVKKYGKKYNYRFFGKDKPTHGRIKTTRQVFRNGKWRAE